MPTLCAQHQFTPSMVLHRPSGSYPHLHIPLPGRAQTHRAGQALNSCFLCPDLDPADFLGVRRSHCALNSHLSSAALELSPLGQTHWSLLHCARYEPSLVLLPGGPRPIWREAEGLKGCEGSHGLQRFKAPQMAGLSRLAGASVWVSQQNICPHRNCFCTVFKAPPWSQESQLGNP